MSNVMTPPIRLPQPQEPGVPFSEWLLEHESRRATRDRLIVLLSQWDDLRDRLGHEPSVREYAQHWRVPEAIAYRQVGEFRRVLGCDPGQLADLIWEGVAQQQD